MRWKYKVFEIHYDLVVEVEDFINEWCADGWELFSFAPVTPDFTQVVFRRIIYNA